MKQDPEQEGTTRVFRLEDKVISNDMPYEIQKFKQLLDDLYAKSSDKKCKKQLFYKIAIKDVNTNFSFD